MLKKECEIAGQSVGGSTTPYVIAEAGSNFNQNLDTARRLIDAAAKANANAVKFQLFRADALYPKLDVLYEVFKSIELNPDWVPKLSDHANGQGIAFMASAFDMGSIDTLESVGVPAHKIASSETADLGFLHYVASKGKPLVISTGMCDMVDVEEAVNVCLGIGNTQVILLQCGAMYPLPADQVHLGVIASFKERFGCPVGFSDHTLGQAAAAAAVGLGATVFEKHFTLDRSAEGPDHFYALEPDELSSYVATVQEAHQSLGSAVKEMLPDEKQNGRREGLYAARDLSEGETISLSDLITKRPAIGIRARYQSSVSGAILTKQVRADEPISWDALAFGKKR